MSWIIYLDNSYCISDREYLYFNHSTKEINTFHDPKYATVFNTKQDAKQHVTEHYAFSMSPKYTKLSEALDLYNNTVPKYRTLPFRSDLDKKYNNESPKEILQWRIGYYKADENSISYDSYKTWPELYCVFKNLFTVESYYNDSYTKKYISFKMKCDRKSDFKTFKKELKLALPHITLIAEDDFYKISIFDSGCGEGGLFYYFLYNFKDPNKHEIISNWGETCKGTLEEIFKYWKDNLYYE